MSEEVVSRRSFLQGVKGWSAVVVGLLLSTGASGPAYGGGWVNRRGGGGGWINGHGGGWVNGGGWINGGGAWINGGGGGWINGGGGGWVNRRGGGGWLNGRL